MTDEVNYTKLEKACFDHPAWQAVVGYWNKKGVKDVLDVKTRKEDLQGVLDIVIKEYIMDKFTPAEICRSNQAVYNDTADDYLNNPHTKFIIKELLTFMHILADRSCVIDMGCGYGKDTMFMAVNKNEFREKFISSELLKYAAKSMIPKKSFCVGGMDASETMIDLAISRFKKTEKKYAENMFRPPHFIRGDIHTTVLPENRTDGIWSCAALFTHTPRAMLDEGMRIVAQALKPGGIFFTSYTQDRGSGQYDKLLLSSTGRIKYFSQPNPQDIIDLAAKHGLWLLGDTKSGDYRKGNDFKKGLFASHFFIKRQYMRFAQ